MREVTTEEVAECLRKMTRNKIPDIASVILFKDAVNNNSFVEDMDEEEFINDFLPCAIMAFTQAVYDKICPVTTSGE